MTYNISIHGIDILEKSIARVQLLPEDQFNFEVKTQIVTEASKKKIVTIVIVDIRKANPSADHLGKLMVAIEFQFENFENGFTKKVNGVYQIPLPVENLLKTISISTTRGIMYSEFRGTQLHRAFLPIILTDSLMAIEGNLSEK